MTPYIESISLTWELCSCSGHYQLVEWKVQDLG